jgi:hypothetical protein
MKIITTLKPKRLLTPNFLHLFALASEADISLKVCDRCDPRASWACPLLRLVHIAPPDTDEAYAIALHELGHLCHPDGNQTGILRSKDPAVKLAEEQAAWTWAKEHALRWTPAMEDVLHWGIASYHEGKAKAA